MRRQLLSLLLALAALLTALAPPAYPPTLAQDGTPIPPVFVSDAPRMIARPPLGDTFDTAAGWLPDGLWRFEASAGYDGAGWRVEGAQRGMTSTLEFGGLIDLSGKTSAQLIYRQRGSLPETDIVAVEVSLDGGLNGVPSQSAWRATSSSPAAAASSSSSSGGATRIRHGLNLGGTPFDAHGAAHVSRYRPKDS